MIRRAPEPEAVRLVQMDQEMWRNSLAATPAAVSAFREAIQIDSSYAPAYVGLATMQATYINPDADRMIAEALRVDPDSSAAHATVGFIAMIHRWDWPRAEREFQRALEMDPRNTEARRWYSTYLSFRGGHEAAAEQIRAALEVEPGSAALLMQQCLQRAYEGSL